MTRNEHRAMCITAMAKARWRLDCMESAEEYRRAGWTIPERWADPWDESGTGLHQQQKYISDATFIFNACNGIARVNPIEATDEMIDAAWQLPCIGGQEPPYSEVYRVMSANGDLTNNVQEKEP